MKSSALSRAALPALIVILGLADGLIHLLLDVVLFHGNFVGALRPPPGAAPSGPPPAHGGPPFPLPLNQLFLLNFVGYVALVVVFCFGGRLLGRWRWLIDAVFIVYTLLSIAGWIQVGEPNPNGLGYLSKAIEIVLIVALAVHAWTVLAPRRHALRRA